MKNTKWLVMALAIVALVFGNGCMIDGNQQRSFTKSWDIEHPNGEKPTKQNAKVVNMVEHHQAKGELNIYGPLTTAKKVIGLPFELLGELIEVNVVAGDYQSGYSGQQRYLPQTYGQQVAGGRHIEVIGGQQYPVRDGYHAIIKDGQVFETPNTQ